MNFQVLKPFEISYVKINQNLVIRAEIINQKITGIISSFIFFLFYKKFLKIKAVPNEVTNVTHNIPQPTSPDHNLIN